ncbi:flavodoxin [Arthrobacter bambusae]|uniref:flavodoxin n=1 Tax=Arthrobacter bambusae TaxID=1338426 RepID=UPI001F50C5B7|nr:flavodoxin [Arthrobacter bambusae]
MSGYDTVLQGSPIWNVRAPMSMSTFIESVNLKGKTVMPFVTYAVSGMGGVDRRYRKNCREHRPQWSGRPRRRRQQRPQPNLMPGFEQTASCNQLRQPAASRDHRPAT